MARIRLDPEDEYTHAVEAAENFNESMYFNVYDPAVRTGGFFRVGNRPNEGYAEVTTCLYLPDGSVGFMFGRPEISGNGAFDAGGMRFECHVPFEDLRVGYEGKVVLLDNPLDMADPRKGFKENPWVDAAVELRYAGVSPMFGGELVGDDDKPLAENPAQAFARAHYEQHVAAKGTIRVGDDEWAVDGFGLRDHSWGPRFWQAPWFYRWLTANFGADFGFMVSIVASREGVRRMGGMVLSGGEYSMVDTVEIDTDWTAEGDYHDSIRVRAKTWKKTYEIEGRVLSLVPLRNRRAAPDGTELMTRISEGLTEWSCEGRTGYGLSEYLDQIVDGRPVGLVG